MRNFTPEDFSGAGQYLIRNDKAPGKYIDPGFMSTVMYKVGYITNNFNIGTGEQITTLTSMADGWTRFCHYLGTEDEEGNKTQPDKWTKVIWQGDELGDHLGKQRFCNYLNDPKLSQEFRFATQEEVTKVVMYQSTRWRN